MELSRLDGNIIGVVSKDYKRDDFSEKLVKDIVLKKTADALKMVGFTTDVANISFDELSTGNQNRVILASHLHDDPIVLVNFSAGLTFKDIEFFKKLFKRIATYGKKIVLIDNNSNLLFNLVDKIYVINEESILYETSDLFDKELSKYIDLPKIVEFTNKCEKKGIKINHYKDLDELLKAIYRIKS